MFNRFLISVIFIISVKISLSQQIATNNKEIAIIFDGVPMDGIELSFAQTLNLNYELTRILEMMKIPSVGFVNEIKIAEPLDSNLERRKALLELWTKNNLTLGNFTYSKLDPNKVSFDEFKDDIEKGDIFSNEFLREKNKRVVYFRFPLETQILDEEKNKKIFSLLKSKKYTVVPKTISNDDQIFEICYLRSRVKDDSLVAQYIVKKYIEHTQKVLEYYESLSLKVNGNYFSQILSLNINLLNVEIFPYIVSLLQEKNYKIVSLNEAINNSVYLNFSEEQKMSDVWEVLSQNKYTFPHPPQIPIVIKKLYENISENKYHIFE